MTITLVLLLLFISTSIQSKDTCKVHSTSGPLHTLALCTIVHNEAWYLEEWIAYHLLLHVDHFYVYDDESTDIIAKVLAPYIKQGMLIILLHLLTEKKTFPSIPSSHIISSLLNLYYPPLIYVIGVVSLIPWNHNIQTVSSSLVVGEPTFTRYQRFAIADCLIHHANETEYFGVWDVDEFAVLNDSFADLHEFVSSS